MRFSKHGDYQIVKWSPEDGTSIRDLLHRYPELVLGLYLVNTSFDSGPLTLSDDELEQGWSMS